MDEHETRDGRPMKNPQNSLPMHARSLDGSATGHSPSAVRAQQPFLGADARPEDVLDLLRELIAEDQVRAARRLVAEAVLRFPGHPKIHLAERVLAEGQPSSNPYVQPTAGAEIEWLKEPPEEARGKWVALIGSEVVAMADSASELMASLRSRPHDQLPVIQYLAP